MATDERPTQSPAVDADAQIFRAASTILRTRGYALQHTHSSDEAVTKAIDQPPDLLIIDLSVPDRSGIDVRAGKTRPRAHARLFGNRP